MISQFIKLPVDVFIDVENVFYAQKTLGWRISYQKLIFGYNFSIIYNNERGISLKEYNMGNIEYQCIKCKHTIQEQQENNR